MTGRQSVTRQGPDMKNKWGLYNTIESSGSNILKCRFPWADVESRIAMHSVAESGSHIVPMDDGIGAPGYFQAEESI
jgi:hypothetical protein